jgi:hypothetical protein
MPFFVREEYLSNLSRVFILPSYVEDEAQAQEAMVSPPRIKN